MSPLLRACKRGSTFCAKLHTISVRFRDVRDGAFSSGAGRGEDENPRSGAGRAEDENPRDGPGRGKKARKSTDPKIRQKFVNCYWGICITVRCFVQGKHYIL